MQADSNGDYQGPNLPPGTYDLVFADPGGAHALSEVTGVAIGSSPLVENAKLSASTINLQGTVTDTLGRPITSANVLVLDSQANVLTVTSTDFNGAYSVTTLPAGSYGVKILSVGYLPSAVTNVTLSGSGSVAGPNFSLTAAGVDKNPFDVLFGGINGFSGQIVQGQLDKFNPAKAPDPSSVRASAQPFLDIVDNDPEACLAELNAGIELHLRLSTLLALHDQWVSDFQSLIQAEGRLVNNMLRDIVNLGLSIAPLVGQLKEAVGVTQASIEVVQFISAASSATATLLDGLSQLANSIIAGKPPEHFGIVVGGFVNTFLNSLSTAAGLKDGFLSSRDGVQKFLSGHSGLSKFLARSPRSLRSGSTSFRMAI